jgi:hypothetical protein
MIVHNDKDIASQQAQPAVALDVIITKHVARLWLVHEAAVWVIQEPLGYFLVYFCGLRFLAFVGGVVIRILALPQ